MVKKIILVFFLSLAVTGLGTANKLMWHLGGGYHSSYIGELPQDFPTAINTLRTMPLGVGAYGGLGLNLNEAENFALGIEVSMSWDLGFNPLLISDLSYQGRGFLKFTPSDIGSLTLFGGFSGDLINAINTQSFHGLNPVFGARLRVFSFYCEYNILTNYSVSDILIHELGLGFSLLR